MMKHIYTGLIASGLMALCGTAQANERSVVTQTYYAPQVAQPYNVAYKVEHQSVPQKRIVRIVKTEEPRVQMVNGYYQIPATQQTTRRRIVTKPVKAIPNLYASVGSSSTPVLFDKTALQAR